jgi:ketosteroid isomerase-like protein
MMTATKAQLLEHERSFWEAIRDRDSRKLASLTCDDYTFVMGGGVNTFRRDDFVAMMTDGDFKMLDLDIDLENASVRELGRDAAAVTFDSHWTFEREGKQDKSHTYTTAIWVRDGGGWKCAYDAETAPGG